MTPRLLRIGYGWKIRGLGAYSGRNQGIWGLVLVLEGVLMVHMTDSKRTLWGLMDFRDLICIKTSWIDSWVQIDSQHWTRNDTTGFFRIGFVCLGVMY